MFNIFFIIVFVVLAGALPRVFISLKVRMTSMKIEYDSWQKMRMTSHGCADPKLVMHRDIQAILAKLNIYLVL